MMQCCKVKVLPVDFSNKRSMGNTFVTCIQEESIMSKALHIVLALVLYQTGCWLLQVHEEGSGGYFHFAATILVGMLFSGQLFMLTEEAAEIVNIDKE
jgi:hypothetical protein